MEEVNLTGSDKNQLKNTIKNKIIFTKVGLVLSVISIILIIYLSRNFFDYFWIIIPAIIFFLTYYHINYLRNSLNKNLKYNFKISDSINVSEKEILFGPDYTDTDTDIDYLIHLDDQIIKKYLVYKEDYDRINIGDIVNVEYTKFGNFILKIECNDLNIKNNINFK